ncbi:DNA repair protein RadC [Patescibacteria group bacterium]|nr:DNA repair protein RadC [Patescibacteria group bacterium]
MVAKRIKDIELKNRPRERLQAAGGGVLTDAEVLAIVLRTGGKTISALDLAQHLLIKYANLITVINTDIEQLKNEPNMGYVKATTLSAVNEIAKRVLLETKEPQIKIVRPTDAYALLKKDLYSKDQEHLYLISLDSRNNYISKDLICIGTVNETLVPAREIYRKALLKNATFVILAHNHPSNDPTPSPQDLLVTEKIALVGKELGIPLIDHIIVTNTTFTSLKALNLFSTYKVEAKKGGAKK